MDRTIKSDIDLKQCFIGCVSFYEIKSGFGLFLPLFHSREPVNVQLISTMCQSVFKIVIAVHSVMADAEQPCIDHIRE
jgi:hypothetical protein